MIPSLLWVIGFFLVDRLRHRNVPPVAGEPLRRRVELSLAQVEHQIWLLKHVFWWYILPFIPPASEDMRPSLLSEIFRILRQFEGRFAGYLFG